MREAKMDPVRNVSKDMVDRLISIGRAQEALKSIMDSYVFQIDKSSYIWLSENGEKTSKLQGIGKEIESIHDQLYNLREILRGEDE